MISCIPAPLFSKKRLWFSKRLHLSPVIRQDQRLGASPISLKYLSIFSGYNFLLLPLRRISNHLHYPRPILGTGKLKREVVGAHCRSDKGCYVLISGITEPFISHFLKLQYINLSQLTGNLSADSQRQCRFL